MSAPAALLRADASVHLRRIAVGLWVLILVAGFARGLVNSSRGNIGIYRECAQAGRHWLAGETIYLPAWDWEMFPYSPIVAVFFVPLSCLPDSLGSGVWRLLLGLAYLSGFAWWIRSALPPSLSSAQKTLFFLLVLPLTAATVLAGQAGGFVAAAIFASLAAAARERWNWCAFFVIIACLLKAYPVAVALLLGVCYPRQLALRLVVAGILGLAAPFLFQDPAYVAQQYVGWVNLLTHGDRTDWALNTANRNLSLLFRVYLVPLPAWLHMILQLQAAAGVAVLCLVARYRCWPLQQHLLALLGLAGSWMTLFGPVVESYTYILIGPTLAWSLIAAWHYRRPPVYRLLLLTSWTIFTMASLAVWFVRSTPLHNRGPHPVAGLLLLAALMWELGRQFAARNEPEILPVHLEPARAA